MSDIGNGRADIVIVGGGSAGAVLASHLTENPTRSVLLVEAGTAYGVDGYPDDLLDAAHVPAEAEHEWGFTARGGAASPEIDAPRAKALGGCSTHNATVAMRARPSDIRDWQDHGLDDWTIEDVLETFRELENTPDGDDAYHGRTGPLPIRQLKYEDLTTSLRGFVDATVAEGFPRVEDFNGPNPSGVGGYPVKRHRWRATEHGSGLSDRGGPQPAEPQDLRQCAGRSRAVRPRPGDWRRNGDRR
jgi:choline dehydrogenase